MSSKLTLLRLVDFVPAVLAILLCASSAQAGDKTIVSFNKIDGANPISTLSADSNGNFYGTTSLGGAHNCGTVFELSPSADNWNETVLYSFNGCNQETMIPEGPLILDKLGNLYGVIQGYYSFGWVFELTKGGDGTWSESIIHTFKPNEGLPNPDLTLDGSGNLYGTTQVDSTGFDGEVFELSPQGGWKETVLYSFYYSKGVGFPTGGPIFDGKGNLYGSAYYGPNHTPGAVYELSPQANSPWTLTVLSSGLTNEPGSRLTFDSSGNLYGNMGAGNSGAIFQLSPTSNGSWKETTVHSFSSGSDGANPQGPVIIDASGNLYGATSWGGTGCNQNLCGTVYTLTPQSGGTWKETILHYFESATDGSEPAGSVFLDSSGNLYGTTYHGGSRYGYGTVYEITP
jgi:uncharacterized repeat protein (TIGR03803 family)